MEDSIEEKVKEIIAEQLGVEKTEIKREISFINDLKADSLDAVEIIMNIEDKYNLKISDEDAEKIKTYGDAVDYIKTHYKPK